MRLLDTWTGETLFRMRKREGHPQRPDLPQQQRQRQQQPQREPWQVRVDNVTTGLGVAVCLTVIMGAHKAWQAAKAGLERLEGLGRDCRDHMRDEAAKRAVG